MSLPVITLSTKGIISAKGLAPKADDKTIHKIAKKKTHP
jgi:hypothetical protein